MNCRTVEHHATTLAEGKLTAAQRSQLEAHVQGCPRCRAVVARVTELIGEIASAEKAELSTEFWPRLYRRVQAHDAERAERARRSTVWRRRLWPVLASASLILGIWTGIHLGNSYALRQLLPAQKTPSLSATEGQMLYPMILEELPPGSLSALLILDPRDSEPERSEQ